MKATAIRTLQSAFGLPCWQVRWDSQIGLDMSFGAPTLTVREPRSSNADSPRVRAAFARRGVSLRGSHWLVITAATWRLELADGLVVRDTASARRLAMSVARLEGEKLDAIAINRHSGLTTFYFDLGARIVARASADARKDSEIWSLSDRSRAVAIYSAGSYTCTPVNQSPGEPVPIALNDGSTLVIARTGRLRRTILGTLHGAAV